MADGTRLSAKLWLPDPLPEAGVPAILEYAPYRKDDATAAGDEHMFGWFAARGYACVRVDIRGCGDSDGILLGRVPRAGAGRCARRALVDRGAALVGRRRRHDRALVDGLQRPPGRLPPSAAAQGRDQLLLDRRPLRQRHPLHGRMRARSRHALVGDDDARLQRPAATARCGRRGWRESWLRRIDETPPFVEDWLSHQRRDAFWKHGSVGESYNTIACPLLMVGGWADAYRSTVLRVLEGYDGPCKGLIGPWSHHYGFDGLARALDRLPAGGAALVGSLAQGRRDGRDGGARAARLDAGVGARRLGARRRPPRPLGRPSPSGRPPAARARTLALAPGALGDERAGAGASGLDRGHARVRHRRGRLARLRAPRRRRRSSSAPRTGARSSSTRSRWARRSRSSASRASQLARQRRSATGAARRPALRRRARRHVDARDPRRAQPHPSREPRAARRRSFPASRSQSGRAQRDRARLPARPPHPARHLADLLAVGVAVARHGGADVLAPGSARSSCPSDRGPPPSRRSTFGEPEWAPEHRGRVVPTTPSRRTITRDVATGRLTITTDFSYFGRQTYRNGLEYREDMRDSARSCSATRSRPRSAASGRSRMRQGEREHSRRGLGDDVVDGTMPSSSRTASTPTRARRASPRSAGTRRSRATSSDRIGRFCSMRTKNPNTRAAPLTARRKLAVEGGFQIAYRVYGSGSRTLLGLHGASRREREIPDAPQRGHRRGHTSSCTTTSCGAATPTGPTTHSCGTSRASSTRSRPCGRRSVSATSRSTGSRGEACLRRPTRSHIRRTSTRSILSNTCACAKDYLLDISDHRVSLGRDMHAAMLKHEQDGTMDSPEYQDAVAELYARYLYRSPAVLLRALARGVRGHRCGVHARDGPRLRALGPPRVHGHPARGAFDISARLGEITVPTLVLWAGTTSSRPSAAAAARRRHRRQLVRRLRQSSP